MDARALSFGTVAEQYDRYRPGYPDGLLAEVVAPLILEAGAGTGRATRALAERGAKIVAVEADPAMAAVVRARTQDLDVDVVTSRFEDYEPEPHAFDRVVSAQAWHWIDPAGGAATAAKALKPDGALCVWWNRARELEGPLWEAIHAAYREHAPELRDGGDRFPDTLPGFTPWTRREYHWTAHYDADHYAALVQTHSDHIALAPDRRARLVAAIRAAIGDQRLEYPYRAVLLTAQPTGPSTSR